MSANEPNAPFDIAALLQQAQAMQQQLVEAQQAAADLTVEGQAGGGVVRVRVTGGLEFESVSIRPEAVDPDDVAMLEDLVVTACNDAMNRAQELNRQALGGLDPSNLGLPGLPGITDEPGPSSITD